MIWFTYKSINRTKKNQTHFMSGAGRQVAPLSQFPQWPCHRHPFNPAQWSEISPSTWKSPLNVGWQTTKAPLFDINILFISWQKQLQTLPCSHDWLVKISCLKSVQIGTYLLLAWNSLWCTAGQHLHFSVLNFLTIQNSFSHQTSQFVSQNVLSSSSLPQHLKEVDKI